MERELPSVKGHFYCLFVTFLPLNLKCLRHYNWNATYQMFAQAGRCFGQAPSAQPKKNFHFLSKLYIFVGCVVA